MKYNQQLIKGTLIKRYKRFLADILLDSGETVVAHCPNSGAMTGCALAGQPVYLSTHDNPKRKLKYTWELIHNGKCWININTHQSNAIVSEAIAQNKISELLGYKQIKQEKTFTDSRFDLLLENEQQKCFVEIKSVTLTDEDDYYMFPDAVTKRGAKHMNTLVKAKQAGYRACVFFLINRSDAKYFKPAEHIDPKYSAALKQALSMGVELIAYRTKITPQEIIIDQQIKPLFSM